MQRKSSAGSVPQKQMKRVEHELAKALIPFLKIFAPWGGGGELIALLTNLSSTHL
jgi:hypothetical protein